MTLARNRNKEDRFLDLAAVITRVMNQFNLYEEIPRTYGCGRRLYRAEIYTVEAIGRFPHINVTQLADHLGITKGAASQAITKLVRKGLVRKGGFPGTAKGVRLELTPLGRKVSANLKHHYHLFYEASVRYYGAAFSEKVTAFQRAFEEFGQYFAALIQAVPIDYPPGRGPTGGPFRAPESDKDKEH